MKSSKIIIEETESVEGGYEARALTASIFTEADSIQELEASVRCDFDEGKALSIIGLHRSAIWSFPRESAPRPR